MKMDSSFEYRGISLVMTCPAYPEQYDAFDGRGRKVGYLRLRHGWFMVERTDRGHEPVYQAEPKGDGEFDPAEREGFLRQAIHAIKDEIS